MNMPNPLKDYYEWLGKYLRQNQEEFVHAILTGEIGETLMTKDQHGKHQNNLCKQCNTCYLYDHKFDALYCPQCNEWKEDVCGSPRCCYCHRRPDKPRNNEVQ